MEAVWDRVWVRVLGSHFWGFGGYLGFHLGVFGIPFLGLFGAIWDPIFGSDGGTSGQGFGTPFLGQGLGWFWGLSSGLCPQDPPTVVVPDLRLCTVKPCPELERRFCFEVVSPNK